MKLSNFKQILNKEKILLSHCYTFYFFVFRFFPIFALLPYVLGKNIKSNLYIFNNGPVLFLMSSIFFWINIILGKNSIEHLQMRKKLRREIS
jgi:hypothetical protein